MDMKLLNRFRPLLGFFIFQYTNGESKNIAAIVSVPYWGSLYFNYPYLCYWTIPFLFPSPTGVLYISIIIV